MDPADEHDREGSKAELVRRGPDSKQIFDMTRTASYRNPLSRACGFILGRFVGRSVIHVRHTLGAVHWMAPNDLLPLAS